MGGGGATGEPFRGGTRRAVQWGATFVPTAALCGESQAARPCCAEAAARRASVRRKTRPPASVARALGPTASVSATADADRLISLTCGGW